MEATAGGQQASEALDSGCTQNDGQAVSSGSAGARGNSGGEGNAQSRTGWVRWTQEEHDLLASLVAKHGLNRSWSVIASHIPGRTGKQCRERWLNHTGNDTKKGNWASSEEMRYVMASEHATIGSHWSQIARSLPGRSDNSVKNHWNATWRSKVMHKPQSILWLYTQELKANHPAAEALKRALIRWEKNVAAQHVLGTLGFWPSDKFTDTTVEAQPGQQQSDLQAMPLVIPSAAAARLLSAPQFLGQRSSNNSDTSLEQFPGSALVSSHPLDQQKQHKAAAAVRSSGTSTDVPGTLACVPAPLTSPDGSHLGISAAGLLMPDGSTLGQAQVQPQLVMAGGGFMTQAAGPMQIMLNGQQVQLLGMPPMMATVSAPGMMQAGQLQMMNGMQLMPANNQLTTTVTPFAAPMGSTGGGMTCIMMPNNQPTMFPAHQQTMSCGGGAMMMPMGLAPQQEQPQALAPGQQHVVMTVSQLQELLAARTPAAQDATAPPAPAQVVPSMSPLQDPAHTDTTGSVSHLLTAPPGAGRAGADVAAAAGASTQPGPTVHAMAGGQAVALNPQQQAALLTQLLTQQGISAVMV